MPQLETILEQTRRKLPRQAPLEFFIHLNALRSFENEDFFDGVKNGASLYKTQAFLPLFTYQEKYKSGRISPQALSKSIETFINKKQLSVDPSLLADLLVCSPIKQEISPVLRNHQARCNKQQATFYKDWIHSHSHSDIDTYISPIVFDFLAGYYDFGLSQWKMPNRRQGSWNCFKELLSIATLMPHRYDRMLYKIINTYQSKDALEVIADIQDKLKINNDAFETYIFELSYRYKGWAATICSLEENPQWVKTPDIYPSFSDFVAILLVCEFAAIQIYIKDLLPKMPQIILVPDHSESFLSIFQYFLLKHPTKYHALLDAFPKLTDKNREEIWHIAYENTLYEQFIRTYKLGLQYPRPKETPIQYQVLCCIDDREESFRRYLEIDPECETFGVAGHFNLSILYKSLFSKTHRALSPPTIKPHNQVRETRTQQGHQYPLISLIGDIQHLLVVSSKHMISGFFISLFIGYLSIIPFLIGIFSPKLRAKMNRYLSSYLTDPYQTELRYKQEDIPEGFSLEERINIAESLLKNSGFMQTSARYIFIIGHGSSSLNNPHQAAYDCGACGGGRGDANARVCAKILNEPDVRLALKSRGIHIPQDTVFIRGYHNTCNGTITFFRLPEQTPELKLILLKIQHASLLDAKERCRRFEDADTSVSDQLFADYIQGRATDLRQARPEYGHTTNCLCIIGPRQMSKSLYLDRRSFLLSYNPDSDIDGVILNQLLQAVVPVCLGINMDYYFSRIDNDSYGCGTKLPHNVTALLGVMNGYMSDLQLGLPWQMVEIHEPIRLLFCIYCSVNTLSKLLKQDGHYQRLIKNRWVELVVHDLNTQDLYRYEDDQFKTIDIDLITDSETPIYNYNDPKFFVNLDNIEFGIIRK